MRDNFAFDMLPIVQDNMSYVPGVRTFLSSNGYYGYQPTLLVPKRPEEDSQACFMEVQFESPQSHNTGSRKRAWDFGNDFREFKKRRQNDSIPFVCTELSPTPNRNAIPTHNIPDMSRCIMGHYI